MLSGSTRSGWSWPQALTARCSHRLSGKTSVVIGLDIGFAAFQRFDSSSESHSVAGRRRGRPLQALEAPALDPENEVAMPQGAQAMGNDECGAVLHKPLHRFYDAGFGF